ncbi:MAG: GTP 3',8-cyclase MoaA [Firmicutes bacterium]|nr:GTP 3',8-cyclase MoaA [Bacillota bacterium]
MKDNYGRTIEYLRISVTDRCNQRCIHCMPEGGVALMEHGDILSYEEIGRVAAEAARLGVRKIRLTGGEPLVRPQLHRLVALLKETPGIETVVLTTNAVLLKDQLPDLLAAGLDGVNASLNAMDREAYRAFTGRDLFDPAMEGLQAALDTPDLKVKINCVPTIGREKQLIKLAGLARDTRASVRFIELMPIGMGGSLQGIEKDALLDLFQRSFGEPVRVPSTGSGTAAAEFETGTEHVEVPHSIAGPAEYVRFPGFLSDIGFISAVSHRFCEDCNRIRLTADGKLKSCLAFPAGEDVKEILRNGGSQQDISDAIVRCIQKKPEHHQFGLAKTEEDRLMSQIGG